MKKKDKKYFVSCIVAAGGKGTRMGAEVNKIFLDILNIPVLSHTLSTLNKCKYIDEIIIVTAENDLPGCNDIVKEFRFDKVKSITVGGATRQESVKNGLSEVCQNSDFVMVHDAARPLLSPEKLCDVLEAAFEFGAAALGVPEKNTIKAVDENGFISHTIDRSNVIAIHTPQIFRKDTIMKMYENAEKENVSATDDCYLAEVLGVKIKMVCDSYDNIKITTKEDLVIAEQILTVKEDV